MGFKPEQFTKCELFNISQAYMIKNKHSLIRH